MEQVQWLMDRMNMVPWPVREPARTAAPVGRCTFERRPRSDVTLLWLFYTAARSNLREGASDSVSLVLLDMI